MNLLCDLGQTTAATRSPRGRLVAYGVLLALGTVAMILLAGPRRAEVVAAVHAWGPAAPAVFVAVSAVGTLLLVPGSVLTMAAGALFGPLTGAALSVVGGLVGSTAAFCVGRRLGRRSVEQLAGQRMERIDAWLRRYGVIALVYVRFVPLVPYPAMNYAAGVTGLPARTFVLGTSLGLVPGALAYATFGGTIDDPTSPPFLAAVAGMVVLALAGPAVQRWRRTAALPTPRPASRPAAPLALWPASQPQPAVSPLVQAGTRPAWALRRSSPR